MYNDIYNSIKFWHILFFLKMQYTRVSLKETWKSSVHGYHAEQFADHLLKQPLQMH